MLLAIDTSTSWSGLALYHPGEVIAECTWKSQAHHTAQLAPNLEHLLRQTGTSMEAIQGVAVALGPGSFTALRVGLALAKGICLARGLPIVGIPTLDILAASQAPRAGFETLLAVLQAGRGRLAVNRYTLEGEEWKAIGTPAVLTFEALLESLEAPTHVCGEFTAEQRTQLEKHPRAYLPPVPACVRRPAVLAELGWRRLQKGEASSLAALAPIYLHVHETIS
ncbi:MAG: tRNA (adenosine(37)-N6)-threonylcarbamoyltransferase complex dimerization subunit type 1 TsaB [Anaerolineales bacterium]